MNEKIIQFGPQNIMMGIITEPKDITLSIEQNKPAVIILNAGLIHRVGPNRMWVCLARELAQLGFLVLRFDFPSVGDSSKHISPHSQEEQKLLEMQSALNILNKRYKVKRFVTLGICSGAINSHLIASKDNRICGAILLDGYIYPTNKHLINTYKESFKKIFHPSIFRRIKNKYNLQYNSMPKEIPLDYLNKPTHKQLNSDLQQMLLRQMKLLYIYSGSYRDFSYQNQLKDCFSSIDFKNYIQVCHFSNMDHTYTLQRDRIQLLQLLCTWFSQHYGD